MEIIICNRCGYGWETEQKKHTLCASCRIRKQTTYKECIPWQGHYDEDQITPVENGQPILPGKRTCGHADCVNTNHIIRRN